MNIDVSFHSDFVAVLHVLKRAELVEDLDAEVVDEGIIIIGSVQWHPITGDPIGGGIFVVVEQSACVQTLHRIGNEIHDIAHDNVHDVDIQISIS
jgi:hypothetical protein